MAIRVVLERSGNLRGLGRIIARARLRAGMTQPDFAAVTHISQSHISLIERGQRRPSPEMLRHIARHLELSYDELAELAGYADMLVDDDWQRVPAPKRGPLKRLADRYSTADLNAVERFLADLFLHRLPDSAGEIAQDEGADDGSDERPEPGADHG